MKTASAEQALDAYFREGTSWDDDRVAEAHRSARVALACRWSRLDMRSDGRGVVAVVDALEARRAFRSTRR